MLYRDQELPELGFCQVFGWIDETALLPCFDFKKMMPACLFGYNIDFTEFIGDIALYNTKALLPKKQTGLFFAYFPYFLSFGCKLFHVKPIFIPACADR